MPDYSEHADLPVSLAIEGQPVMSNSGLYSFGCPRKLEGWKATWVLPSVRPLVQREALVTGLFHQLHEQSLPGRK
jgi:hypothetical protein